MLINKQKSIRRHAATKISYLSDRLLAGFLTQPPAGPHPERYGRRSSVITSQLPIDRWHEIIGDPTYADAILDRLIHNAHRIELAGESLRRTQAKQSRKA